MTDLFDQMKDAILKFDTDEAVKLAEQAVSQGIKPLDAIEKGFAKGMEEVGHKFDKLEIFLPDVIIAADAMIAAVDVLKKEIREDQAVENAGKVIIGTIKGDVHDIGKNIVKTMLMASGFEVYDLGKDVPPAAFIERAKELNADIIAVSALCTSTMLHMPDIIRMLNEESIRDKFKVVLGGAPVLPDWAEKIGADGYGENSSEAVQICKKMVNKN